MRRRRKKGADIKLLSYTDYVIRENIEDLKGKWSEKFQNNNPIHVEFGTGRGKFITTLAKQNPDIKYLEYTSTSVIHGLRQDGLREEYFIEAS